MSIQKEVWYCLVDVNGDAFMNASGDFVSIKQDGNIANVRHAIKAQDVEILNGVGASQLKVFESEAAFRRNNPESLRDDQRIDRLGEERNSALWVMVPTLNNAANQNLNMAAISWHGANTSLKWNSIVIMNKKENGETLLTIHSNLSGRPWNRVLLFISSICGEFDDSKYELFSLENDSNSPLKIEPLHLTTAVLPGKYSYTPLLDDNELALTIKFERFPIIPSGRLARHSSGSATPRKKARIDSSERLAAETATTQDRSALFRERIIQRDQHCVISRQYRELEASYIVAHAWWKDDPNRRDCLPQEIREIIGSLEGGIDGVANGILLNRNFAGLFDNGNISFQFSNGHYNVVAISPDYEKLDGMQIDESLRIRWDNTSWWCQKNWPNPYLVKFHLRNSIFAHFKAAGETSDSDDEASEDDEVVLSRKIMDVLGKVNFGTKMIEEPSPDTLADVLM